MTVKWSNTTSATVSWTAPAALSGSTWSAPPTNTADPYITPRMVAVTVPQGAGMASLVRFAFPLDDEDPAFRVEADRPVFLADLPFKEP
jgi:hypothetical protein